MSYKKQKSSSLKSRKPSITRRPVLTLAFLILFIAAVFATIKIVQAINQPKADQPATNNTQQDNKTEQKSNSSTANTSGQKTDDKTPAQFEGGNNTNQPESITGNINFAEKQGDTLHIRVTIDQAFSTSGTCSLVIKQNDATIYTAEAVTETIAGSSTCQKAFDVPAKDFSGTYQLKITVTADNKSGIIEKEVTL